MSENKKLRTVKEVLEWIDKDISEHREEWSKGKNKFVDGAMTALGNLRSFIEIPVLNPLPEEREPVYRWVKGKDRLPPDNKAYPVRWVSVNGQSDNLLLTTASGIEQFLRRDEDLYVEWLEQIPAPIPQPVADVPDIHVVDIPEKADDQPVSRETETEKWGNMIDPVRPVKGEWMKAGSSEGCSYPPITEDRNRLVWVKNFQGREIYTPWTGTEGCMVLWNNQFEYWFKEAPPIPESLPTEVQCPNCLGEGTEVRSEFGPETCRCCGGLKSVAMDTWEYWTKEYGGNPIPTPVRSINAPTEVPLEILQWISDFQYLSPSPRFNNNEDAWFAGMEEMGQAMYHKLIEDWFSKGPEGYSMCLAAMQKGIYSRDKQIKELQASLSSMKAENKYLQDKLEDKALMISSNVPPDDRDGISPNWIELWSEIERWYGDIKKKETGRQFLLRMQTRYSDGPLRVLIDAMTKDRDLYRTESESYKKAWEEATAVLGERNVEKAELEEELKEAEARYVRTVEVLTEFRMVMVPKLLPKDSEVRREMVRLLKKYPLSK